jgi:hypothetical protein
MNRHIGAQRPGSVEIPSLTGRTRGAHSSKRPNMAPNAPPGNPGIGDETASRKSSLASGETVPNVDDAQELKRAAQAGVSRFVRSLQSLLVVSRIYEATHPLVTDALEGTVANLRQTLEIGAPLAIAAEGAALKCRVGSVESLVLDTLQPATSLATVLRERGLESLVFSVKTSAEEIEKLARLLNERDNVKPAWPRLLSARGISAIRANVSLKQSAGETLATLVAALVAHGASPHVAVRVQDSAAATLDDLTAALRLLARLEPILTAAQKSAPKQTAETLHLALSDAEPRTLSLVLRVMARLLVRQDESADRYMARLAEALLVETVIGLFLAQRLATREVRALFTALAGAMTQGIPGAAPPPAGPAQSFSPALVRAARALLPNVEEATGAAEPALAAAAMERYSDSLHEQFWNALPAREKSSVLHSADAWCVPATALRSYLERLAGDRASPSGAPVREARSLLMSYAAALSGEEPRPRRTVASGLLGVMPLVNMLWWRDTPVELDRIAVRALIAETSPGISATLAELVNALANAAIEREDFHEYEQIVAALERAGRDAENSYVAPLVIKLLGEQRWPALVQAGLNSRTLDALGRLLRRDPQRLVDHLAVALNADGGMDEFAAMVRLVNACGESVLGTLVENLSEPRSQRAATAIKLLAAADPLRLVKVLPRVLSAWDWSLQDLAVSELSRRGASARIEGVATAFLKVLTEAHEMVAPMMLDEIGLAKEKSAIPMLMKIAAGDVELLRDVFIRIKAVEALGRMRATEAADLFRKMVREHQGLVHSEPAGLRAAAQEALALLENQPSSARLRSGEETRTKAGFSFGRPRRYTRIQLPRPFTARIEGPLAAKAGVSTISMGGAFLQSTRGLAAGEKIQVSIRTGLRQIHSTAVVRNVSPKGSGVEFLHMAPKDRERLRRVVRHLQK